MNYISIKKQLLFFLLFFGVTTVGFGLADGSQIDNRSLRVDGHAVEPDTLEQPGMPERGQFLFRYRYTGEEIDPKITISHNGEIVASLNHLVPTAFDTLVHLQIDKDDLLVYSNSFGETDKQIIIHEALTPFPQGFWARAFSVEFRSEDPEGNVKVYGTMNFEYYLYPPFDGFLLTADPSSIAPGESTELTLQAIEFPAEPVIIPEITAVDILTTATGLRLGSFALPEAFVHGMDYIHDHPYEFLRITPVLYEADPDTSLLEGTSENVAFAALSSYNWDINGTTSVEVRKEEDELEQILLGETKYFAAVEDPDDESSILIKEVTAGTDGPSEPEGLLPGAFGDDPVEVLSGGKPGVYWERKWAHIDSNGSISGGDLPPGMIRLVGRYWEEDNDFRVTLNASSGNRSGELEVEVVRPGRLGNQFRYSRDVQDVRYDLDQKIIEFAGKHGIPPQLIKGHIEQESFAIPFGGDIGWGFSNGYLYEPFTRDLDRGFRNLRTMELREPWNSSPYRVTETSMGVGDPVPDHQHLERLQYPQTPASIWDMIVNYSVFEGGSSYNAFAQYARDGSGRIWSPSYNFINRHQENIEGYVEQINQRDTLGLTEPEIIALTNYLLSDYLQNRLHGGLKNIIAQTRMFSSYGLLQLTYTTAIGNNVGYPSVIENGQMPPTPEELNEVDIQLLYAGNLYLTNMSNIQGIQSEWPEGYESAWQEIVRSWNRGSPRYRFEVMSKIHQYLPEKGD